MGRDVFVGGGLAKTIGLDVEGGLRRVSIEVGKELLAVFGGCDYSPAV
jgi:hypothetical protein